MTDRETIVSRLAMLRAEMKRAGIDVYLMTTSDCHASEYVGDRFKVVEYFTGCTSDNVVLIIDATGAYLWTDGRYFISAQGELEGTGVSLMRSGEEGVPTVGKFLQDTLHDGMVLGFDGRCVNADTGAGYRRIAASRHCRIEGRADLPSKIWIDRPALPQNPVTILPDSLAGESFESKLDKVREKFLEAGAGYLFLSKLDDIMWLTNLRGRDIQCNPVALTYALIGRSTFDLFIQDEVVTDTLSLWAREKRIKLHDYHDLYDYLQDYHFEGPVMIDNSATNDSLIHLLREKTQVINHQNPTEMLKAVKNAVEIENSKKFYLLDSAQVCRFIYRIKKAVAAGEDVTEISAAAQIDALRAEIPGFMELSFPTISAFGANAAMAHYAPTEESCSRVDAPGMLLVDSGGQYMGATTDETRTIVFGEVSQKMKRDFTLVAVSNLALMNAVFAKGTTGTQLDAIAREPLARYGLDFNHGTGHGIGYILNVHEGPQRIGRPRKNTVDPAMEAGMITSDEPGIYREGEYGIRTESITLCVPAATTEFGEFLKFEPLTYIPIDLDAIDPAYMTDTDLLRLNEYHAMVRDKISPLLDGEERTWLEEATRPVSRV